MDTSVAEEVLAASRVEVSNAEAAQAAEAARAAEAATAHMPNSEQALSVATTLHVGDPATPSPTSEQQTQEANVPAQQPEQSCMEGVEAAKMKRGDEPVLAAIMRRARSKQSPSKHPSSGDDRPRCLKDLPVLSPEEQKRMCSKNRAAADEVEEEETPKKRKPKATAKKAAAKAKAKATAKAKAKAKAKAAAKVAAKGKAKPKATAKAKGKAPQKHVDTEEEQEDHPPPAKVPKQATSSARENASAVETKPKPTRGRPKKATPNVETEEEQKVRAMKEKNSRKSSAYHAARKAALDAGADPEEAKAKGKEVSWSV